MAPIIEVSDVRKNYGAHKVLEGVDFSVDEGEIFGVLGPNGAGKTTTVECISGLRSYDKGKISVLGHNPKKDRKAVQRVLGAQLQESKLPEKLRVRECLQLFASFYDEPADIDALIDQCGLRSRRNAPFARLSGGQKQRLSIALALVGNPKVAVLDELTTGLDPQARRDTWELVEQVRDSGVTVLLVTHFMEEAEYLCDRLALLSGGRISALGTPDDLVAEVPDPQRLRFRTSEIFDTDLLSRLPEVTAVHEEKGRVEVRGEGDLLHAVNDALSESGVSASAFDTRAATLDDAYLFLTGDNLDTKKGQEALR